MKILLFGKNGQLGWELQRSLAPIGQLIALDRKGVIGLCGDLSDLKGLRDTVRKLQPDVIINAAAYTAVDKAEAERDEAQLINVRAPQLLAEEVQKLNGWLIHYSTDYVFNGSGNRPWRENDGAEPLNYYGQSKLEGEQAIQSIDCNHIIFRTSWVYGAHGSNFAKMMLRLARERDHLNVVDDQFGAPTGAELLADITAHIIPKVIGNRDFSGIYHIAPAGETSWCDYARYIVEHLRNNGVDLALKAIIPISTNDYFTPAKRPQNSRLDTRKLQERFALHLPHWQEGLSRMLTELGNSHDCL